MKGEMDTHWFVVNLGDAIIATPLLFELQATLDNIYQTSQHTESMLALYRQASGETQCSTMVYISSAFQQEALVPFANTCNAPIFTDMTFLSGNHSSFITHFSSY